MGEPNRPAPDGPARRWPLGINTYCLRFQRWNDRQLIDYSLKQKLDAIFLQDSLDLGVMDPKHWAEVRAWSKDAGLHLETGGGAILPKSPEETAQVIATLRKNIVVIARRRAAPTKQSRPRCRPD